MPDLRSDLLRKVKVFNESIWEGRIDDEPVKQWLANFSGLAPENDSDKETLHALFLLSRFTYFGSREVRELLRAVFRDLFRQPIINRIRRANGDTTDLAFITTKFNDSLLNTRFLGVGNPSESGTHLLYYFRQENALPKTLFKHAYDVFSRDAATGSVVLAEPNIRSYVFLDDLCGSGNQGHRYLKKIVAEIKTCDPSVQVEYYMLLATQNGLDQVRSSAGLDRVECVLELDDSFKCFSANSRYFAATVPGIDKVFAESTCAHYGNLLYPDYPLGYGDCQLLIGFHHNTPDNTLPVFWHDEPSPPWNPIFRRYPKFYGWSIP